MVIIVEQPGPSYNILMPIIGGVIAAISLTLYYVSQKKMLNYLEEVWSIVHFWKSNSSSYLSYHAVISRFCRRNFSRRRPLLRHI